MKLKLTAALLSTALLCACMGSSPEKQLPPAAVITPTPTPTVSEVSSMSTAEANKMTARNAIKTNTSSTFDITIMTPIMSGGELVYDNGVTPSVKTAVLTIDLTDPDTTVTEDNKFFITQRTDALQGNTVRGTDTFDLTMSDTVWSGGIKTGLKYSEFGYWETHFNMEVASAVDGNRYYKNDDYIPFYMYDASKKNTTFKYADQGGVFAGSIIGSATAIAGGAAVSKGMVQGDISLNADFISRTFSSDMSLFFSSSTVSSTEWLNISSSSGAINMTSGDAVSFTGDGSFYGGFGSTNITLINQITGFEVDTSMAYGSVSGTFLSETGDNPEEAIGQMYLSSTGNAINNNPTVIVSGVFGAVKQ